ncbi:MAG TPA: primosomal protein N' [Verrucomicrobiales bacterium]|nr:primosomal protein N' [Verrucomicrobiales bacterium]
MPRCAQVFIDGSADLEFTYLVPEELAGRVAVGSRVRVPLRRQKVHGTVLLVAENAEPKHRLLPIDGLLHDRPILTPGLLKLARWSAGYYCASLESILRAMLPDSVRAPQAPIKTRRVARLLHDPGPEALEALQRRAPRQAEMLTLLRTGPSPLPLAALPSAPAVRALVARGWVALEDEQVERDPHGADLFVSSQPQLLSAEQQSALDCILEAVEQPILRRPILLQGVTGSGKTEVYLQAVHHVLQRGRTAIVLVPEIALTPQTVHRFKSRFASRQRQIAVLHSHLSTGERFDEWHKIHRGEAAVVIGARSALFAPLENLGLIVVDEEHESSYKQDATPRYHARDLAVVRSRFEPCALVLGSATPSLESFLNTQRGKYDLVTLSRRVDSRSMPLVRLVDMRRASQNSGSQPTVLSEILRQSIEQRLTRTEQVLLFLNRRGFASSLQCQECGVVCACRHCSVSLTFHQSEKRLICHICGFQQLAPRRCPQCRSPSIRFAGFGTERAEHILRNVFPTARIARIDADAMRRKNTLRDTLEAFRTGRLDILVGTQMIAKGLDFPNVTLVGILNADLGLHLPDFRAGERTFQLLTQVAGRAGRGDRIGEVLVQTFSPHSPAIQFARHHDYEGFSSQELEFRREFGLPPYVHAVLLHVRSKNQRLAEFTTQNLAQRLAAGLPAGLVLGEPLASPLEKASDLFRFQLMIRAPTAPPAVRHLRSVLDRMTFPSEVVVIVDVDPVSLL